MTGVAGNALGVIGGDDLGEGFGFGAVGFVAAGADDSCVELGRLHGSRIVGVFGLGSMTGFAGDDDVSAEFLLIDDIGVAGLAGIVSSVNDGAGGDFGDGCAAIVSVLPKTVGDDDGAQADEGNQGDCHDCREPDEMFNILEQVVRRTPGAGCAFAQ